MRYFVWAAIAFHHQVAKVTFLPTFALMDIVYSQLPKQFENGTFISAYARDVKNFLH